MLKRDHLWKHLGIAFSAALALYLAGFAWVEHRRTRSGPWEVTFIKDAASPPLLQINQPALRITNAEIRFIACPETESTNVTVEFVAGRVVPFAVPFGECVFMDPLFLPGTVTFDLFDHQIELLPKALRIDGREHEWKSGSRFDITANP